MSSTAKTARAAMKSKAQRMVGPDPRGAPIDASGYTPPDAEQATVQTGMRPLSKRQFKKGGKVIGKAEGKAGHHHAGRKPRKSGGRANRYLTPDNLINRDEKMANEVRVGTKHVGGMKRGGRTHKEDGGGLDSLGGLLPMAAKKDPKMLAGLIPMAAGQLKRGGAAKHKLGGGPIGMNPVADSMSKTAAAAMPRKDGGKIKHKHLDKSDELADKDLIKSMVKPSSLKGKKHGGEVHHASCRCEKCHGGRMGRKDGGRNIMEVTGVRPTGGRIAKKDGGRLHREDGGSNTPDFSGAYYDLFTGWHNLDKANPDQIAAMNPQDRQMALAAQGPSRAVTPKRAARPRPSTTGLGGMGSNPMQDPQQRAEAAQMAAQEQQNAQRAMRADNAQTYADAQSKAAEASLNRAGPQTSYYNTSEAARYGQGRQLAAGKSSNEAIREGFVQAVDPNGKLNPGGYYGNYYPSLGGLDASRQPQMMGRGLPPSRSEYGLFQGQAGEPAMVFSRQVPDASVGPVYHEGDNSGPSMSRPVDFSSQSVGLTPEQEDAMVREYGGRIGRKSGGRAKGKTNVNVIIAQHPHGGMGQGPAPMMGAPAGGRPIPVPPPQGMPMGMPAGMPPQMPPQAGGMAMARKRGGRTNYPIETGSGGGEARLDKIKAYGLKPPK